MDELGMMGAMGGGFGMGVPQEPMMDTMMDPQLASYVQMLVDQYGMSPEQAMQLAMTQQPTDPMATPQGALGGMPPQLSEADYMMLAQKFGLVPDGGVGGSDPAYDNQYDIAKVLGGVYEP